MVSIQQTTVIFPLFHNLPFARVTSHRLPYYMNFSSDIWTTDIYIIIHNNPNLSCRIWTPETHVCLCILLLLSRVGVESVALAGILYTQALLVCLRYATRTLFVLQVKGLYLVSKYRARIIITIRYKPIEHFSLSTVSQYLRSLSRGSATARLRGLWFRISAGGMDFCLLRVLCVVR